MILTAGIFGGVNSCMIFCNISSLTFISSSVQVSWSVSWSLGFRESTFATRLLSEINSSITSDMYALLQYSSRFVSPHRTACEPEKDDMIPKNINNGHRTRTEEKTKLNKIKQKMNKMFFGDEGVSKMTYFLYKLQNHKCISCLIQVNALNIVACIFGTCNYTLIILVGVWLHIPQKHVTIVVISHNTCFRNKNLTLIEEKTTKYNKGSYYSFQATKSWQKWNKFLKKNKQGWLAEK